METLLSGFLVLQLKYLKKMLLCMCINLCLFLLSRVTLKQVLLALPSLISMNKTHAHPQFRHLLSASISFHFLLLTELCFDVMWMYCKNWRRLYRFGQPSSYALCTRVQEYITNVRLSSALL